MRGSNRTRQEHPLGPIELVSHDFCPFAQRAAIALAEKGAPLRCTHIDPADCPQWLKAISPLGRLPLLRVAGEVIFDAAAIVEYLDETQPPPLHPADPVTRARHRAWMACGSGLLMDNDAFLMAGDAATMLARRDTLRRKVAMLEQALGNGPYFAGSAFSLVDAVFAPFFRYWDVFEGIGAFHVFDGAPKVQAWRHALAQRPSVRSAFDADYDARLRGALCGHSNPFASRCPEAAASRMIVAYR